MRTFPALILVFLAPLSCSTSADHISYRPLPPLGDGIRVVWPTASRAVGAPCAFDTQCATGRCSAEVAAGACGECVTMEHLGQACDGPHQGCSISAACLDGRCRSLRRSEGERCALGPKGDDLGECDVDLSCEYVRKPSFGLCLPRTRVGESCTNTPFACVNGASCDQATGLCALPNCLSDYACGANAVCGSDALCHPGTLADGAICPIDGSDACAPGLFCARVPPDGAMFKCAALPGKGESCDSDECAAGLFCFRPHEGGPGSCDSPRGLGEKCSTDYYALNACAAPLECRHETCEAACQ